MDTRLRLLRRGRRIGTNAEHICPRITRINANEKREDRRSRNERDSGAYASFAKAAAARGKATFLDSR
jgi:hypothetical protein